MRFYQLLFISLLFSLGGNRLLAQRPQGSSQSYTEVAAKGSDVLALSDDGKILLSIDGGSTYTELHSVTAPDALFDIAAKGDTVIAAGKDGTLLRADFSVDNSVWTEKNSSGVFGDLRGIDHNGALVWIAAGDAILRSINNGEEWSDVTPAGFGFFDAIHDVAFTGTAGNWVAVGEGATGAKAFYSTNGGDDWTASTLPTAEALLAVAADSAGNLLAVGVGGTVLLSTDQGVTFSALTSVNVTQDLTGVDSSAADQWLIGGTQRVLLSVDSDLDSSTDILAPVESGLDTGNDIVIVNGAVIMAGVGEVLPPQITPPETTSLAPIEVTLVPDVPTYQTFYTIDGSSPDSTDLLYSTPFTISETLTVYAVSQLDGVYSVVVSQAFDITIHTLSISPNGTNIDLTLDTSLSTYNYQLKSNPDLGNNAGWTDATVAKPGTGNPLTWTSLNPAGPLFWRVDITASQP